MAMTDAQIRQIAAALANRVYGDARKTAVHNLDELKQAIANIDAAMNASCNAAATKYGAVTVKAAFLAEVQAGAGNLSPQDAAKALAIWALMEAGLL